MVRTRVLVVGGSGYLGQHLLQGFAGKPYDLAFTHHSSPPQRLLDAISPLPFAFHVDLQTGQGFDAITNAFGQPHVVVNCAALSVPRACETDPTAAMAINVPCSLVKWLSSFGDSTTLLIHLSTDQGSRSASSHFVQNFQWLGLSLVWTLLGPCFDGSRTGKLSVYEGVKSFYKEEDEAVPVNMYGKSKVAAEQFISSNWPSFVILRSSIIYGPQTVSPVTKSLPIQWIDGVLSRGEGTHFFYDEFRCPVYVKDLVNIILALTEIWISDNKQMQLVLNIGGPDRVSRVQMAEAVAACRGYNTSLIKPVSASSVNRGVNSPADISMDISKLVRLLGITPISFKDGVKLTLKNDDTS